VTSPASAAADAEAPAAAPTSAADINAQGPKGTAAAKPQTGAAKTAIDKTAAATAGAGAEKAGQTLYAQVKAQVGQLDKKGKQRIMQLLQKSLAQPAAAPAKGAAPAAGAQAAPAAQPAANPAANPAQAAPAQTAPAAEPVKKKGGRKKAAAPSQAEIDADRERLMGPTSDSVIRTGNALAETLARKVEEHKKRIVKENIANGTFTIFRK
jgi:hypothetical protein